VVSGRSAFRTARYRRFSGVAASAALSALGTYLGGRTSFAPLLLAALNTLISLGLFTLLFAAIYKVLPDTPISWREVGIGALITAVLFTIGKSLIGWYLGTTAASSGYGAAGALVLILLWAYYCAQIFLFGAELTRAIAGRPADPAPMPGARKSRSPADAAASPAGEMAGRSSTSSSHGPSLRRRTAIAFRLQTGYSPATSRTGAQAERR